ELRVFVDHEDPVKFSVLTLTNQSGVPRSPSVFGYWEWALGPPRVDQLCHVITELDEASHVVLAQNPYNSSDLAGRVAFAYSAEPLVSATGDRQSFLGRNGSLTSPVALKQPALSGEFGARFDPCAALHTAVSLASGETRRLVFLVGQAENVAGVHDLITRH